MNTRGQKWENAVLSQTQFRLFLLMFSLVCKSSFFPAFLWETYCKNQVAPDVPGGGGSLFFLILAT